jgi:hypothetical protein
MVVNTKAILKNRQYQVIIVVVCLVLLFMINSWKREILANQTLLRHQRQEDNNSDFESTVDDGTFIYFAYASDLLESRLKMGGGPSAKLIGIGRVKGRKFAFSQESKVWKGGVADIVPSANDEVWGAVYLLKSSDEGTLNKQKGTDKADPLYEQINVSVEMNGKGIEAISYSIVNSKRLPFEAAPSPQYKECLIRGAEEQNLPKKYIAALKRIKDNGSSYRRKNVC